MQTINAQKAMASQPKQSTKLQELTSAQLQQVGGSAPQHVRPPVYGPKF